MDVDLKGISNITLIDLIFLSSFTFSILSSNKCRTQQIKNLSVNFLHCISNSNKARDWSRDITLNIKKRAVSINLYNFLIHCARAFVTHMTSHSTAFKDFTWVFTHTNRAWCSVCSWNTMRCILHVEVPTFNCSLHTLTLACRNTVNPLTYSKVSWTKTVSYWQKVFFCNWKFCKMTLRWQIVLYQVSYLRFLHFLGQNFSNTNLYSVNSIFLNGLDLSYLTSINLNDSAGCELTPLVPKMSHTNFVSQNTDSLWKSVDRFSWNNWEVLINLIFKRSKCLNLVCMTEFLWIYCFLVINSTFFCKVLVFET